MATNYFTFGCGQMFKDHYVLIIAADDNRCRELMFEAFGPKWSMQYKQGDYDPTKYGEQELALIIEHADKSIEVHVHKSEILHK